MDPAEAREKLEEYQARRRRKGDVEAERAELAFRELAKGTPLLILSDVILHAPRDAKGRPRLAIARADRAQVHYFRRDWSNGPRLVFDATAAKGGGPSSDTLTLEIALEGDRATWPGGSGYSLVPMVPPAVRGNRALSQHFVLWEVEAWADSRIGAQPDIDPYLLSRVDADLYAVVGEWELTEVERAVMRGRAGR
jgi:hypothetical protein